MIRWVMILILSLQLYGAEGVKSETVQPPQNNSTKKDYIELSDVPTQTIQTQTQLDTIFKKLDQNKEEIEVTTRNIQKTKKGIDKLLNDAINKYLDKLNMRILQKKYNRLDSYLLEIKDANELLEERIEEYKNAIREVDSLQKLWEKTLKNAATQEVPPSVVSNISGVVAKIISSKKKLQHSFDTLLTSMNTLSIYILKIQKLQEKIKEAQAKIADDLFQQNELPYHIMFEEQDFQAEKYIKSIVSNIKENFFELQKYLFIHNDRLWIFFVVLLPLVWFIGYFYHLYRKKRLFIRKESLAKKSFFFIKRPFSTFMILIVFTNLFIFPDMSQAVFNTQLLFVIIPVFRIVATITPRYYLRYLYIFFGLYIVYILNRHVMDSTLMSRSVTIGLSFALLVLLWQVVRQNVLEKTIRSFLKGIADKILVLTIFLLFGAVASNFYGASNLSGKLVDASYTIIYAALLFYTLTVIFTGYTIVLLRRHMATATNLIEEFAVKVERNTTIMIKIVMGMWWLKVVVDVLGLYDYLKNITQQMLELSFEISSFTISLQSVVDFSFIIIATWLLAKFINTLLEVEVFSRYRFPRGMPTAIKTMLNYIIIFIGTIIALSALGISSKQFTVVFGALGVGIGFGLRNIIANFISGIIMVFERPVQIGDVIQIDATMGEVKAIGARSTTIATYDGSEVIIPNADFISKEITNWTFSDDRRRKTLEFKVDFGSDIEKVLHIMESIAIQHKDVLEDPKPLATFRGFGEYYLEFKLYFWLTKNLIVAQSEVAIAVYEALKEAGISMPVPKNETILVGEKNVP